jgi:glycerol-3-phosphate dehydrogenase
MSELLDKMDAYFKNTPKKKVKEDWKKSEKYDKVGITVNEFMKGLKKDKATFMQEYLTRNMKNVNEKLHGQYLKILADTEEQGELAYLIYVNKNVSK